MAKRAYPDSPGRAFGYCRVSTDQQADSGVSLDEQQTKIQARCLENGWHLAHVFIDAGVSGGTPLAKRPQGQQLLDALKPGDIVIASRMDRMFRSAIDALSVIEQLKARRISLWLLDLGGDVTGNGISQLVATILAAVAQFERGLIGERIRDAKRQQRRAQRHLGGSRPFGFTLDSPSDGKAPALVEDPQEQQAIKAIHKMRASGKTLSRSATRCAGAATSARIESTRRALARRR